jgi:proteic killer suppression protein
VIKSFRDVETEKVWFRTFSRKLTRDMQRIAKLKLDLIEAAGKLDDLRIPPGNRLEALAGSRRGQHSIRINDQWRICFQWEDGDAYEVEIVDYH